MFSGVMNGTQSTGDESNDIQLCTRIRHSSSSSSSVTKIQIESPLTVFLKHSPLDFSKVSDSISDCVTSIFPENF